MTRLLPIIRQTAAALDAEFGPGHAAREARWLTFIGLAAPVVLLGLAIIAGEN